MPGTRTGNWWRQNPPRDMEGSIFLLLRTIYPKTGSHFSDCALGTKKFFRPVNQLISKMPHSVFRVLP